MLVRDGVVYEFGSIRIDPSKRTVVRNDGENVPLPSRAFDLLLLLIERRGELVPKEELLARIWPDIHVEESSLPVMISLIRRAIGDDARRQQDIQTVSKQGYRFIGDVKETFVAPAVEPAGSPEHVVEPQVRSAYIRRSAIGACAIAALTAVVLLIYFRAGVRHGVLTLNAAAGAANAGGPLSAEETADMWYRKGRFAWNLQTKAGILQSVEYYQKAIAADVDYAPAWAGLSVSYSILPSYSQPLDDQDRGRNRADAMKAVSLDDRLADAHVALGMVFLIDDRNFSQAEREFRQAVALDPNSSFAQGELALCLVAVDRGDEAVAHARKAQALDPISTKAATDLGIVLYYSHRYTEAETELEEVLKLNPYSYRTHINLGKTYLSLDRFDDALREFEQAATLSNHDPLSEGLTAEAKALGGDIDGARTILAGLQQRARTAYVSPISFAFATVGLGRLDDTLTFLQRALNERSIASLYLKVDPNWQPLHRNAEFALLAKDIGAGVHERYPAVPKSLAPAGPGWEDVEKSK